jgi:hypothetical protein
MAFDNLQMHPSKIKIVAGGHLASALPAVLMENLPIDFAVVGEGEEAMVELTECLSWGADLLEVNGIYFRGASGQIMATAPRARLAELDNLPLPPWEAFPMDLYLQDKHGGFSEQLDGEEALDGSHGKPWLPFRLYILRSHDQRVQSEIPLRGSCDRRNQAPFGQIRSQDKTILFLG